MPNNERISQLEEMMVKALQRIDHTLTGLRQSDAWQQVIMLQMLMQQAETNSTIMRRLKDHGGCLGDLNKPGPGQAA